MKDNKEVNKKELNEVVSLSKKILKMLYIVFIAVLVLASIITVQKLNVLNVVLDFFKVISPLFIGFSIAWLLRPVVLKLNKKLNNYVLSEVIVISSFLVILLVMIYAFVPALYDEINELVGLLPSLLEEVTNSITEFFAKFDESGINLSEFKDKLLLNITTASTNIAKDLPNTIINVIGSAFSGIGNIAIGLLIGIYMLIDYDNIVNQFQKLFPKRIRSDVKKLLNTISVEVRNCVNGTFLIALMVFFCDSIGFTLIGLNAPLLFGAFCGITDLIPYVGPYIGGAAAVIVGFTQSPFIGIGTLIICVIVQLVESSIIYPLVMSKASNLHPVVIIIALLIFGHFFGIIGMVLATPILTILRVIYKFIIQKVKQYS